MALASLTIANVALADGSPQVKKAKKHHSHHISKAELDALNAKAKADLQDMGSTHLDEDGNLVRPDGSIYSDGRGHWFPPGAVYPQ
jgi:Flp pilus assembly protein TadB